MIQKSAECELAWVGLKTQKIRNIIAMIAIFFTTTLIISILAVGISYRNIEKKSNLSQAPNADGGIWGTENSFYQVQKNENVEWASMLYMASDSPIILDRYTSSAIELLVPDASYYNNNDIRLISGTYPEKENDILISDTLAIELNMDMKSFPELPIRVLTANGMETSEKDITMSVCGYYENPLAVISNYSEEAYTSADFLNRYTGVNGDTRRKIYVKFKGELNNNGVETKLNNLNSLADGSGIIRKNAQPMTKSVIKLMIVIILCVAAGAYLMIFNIFNISLMNDIQYWGLLKLLGARKRQIRKILNMQMWVLLLPGMIGGIICGNYLEKIITPLLLESFAENFSYVQNTDQMLFVSVTGAVFAIVTVKISCRKSFQIVAAITPVEALRIRAKKSSKIFIVISLALSILAFITVFTLARSQDIDEQVSRYNTADFTLENRSHYALSNIPFRSLKTETIEKIEELSFVQKVDTFYQAHVYPDYEETDGQKIYDTTARIKNDGKIKEEYEEIERIYGDMGNSFVGNDRKMRMVALHAGSVKNELKGKIIAEGAFDEKKFASENYILYQREAPDLNHQKDVLQDRLVHAGDRLNLSVYDDTRDQYIPVQVTVMAIIENQKGDQYGASMIDINSLILPDWLFEKIYANHEEMISAIKIHVDDKNNYALQRDEIIRVLNDTGETTARLKSVYDSTLSATLENNLIVLVGGLFAIFFAFLGIVNIINAFVTEIIAQEREYTKMQAIGMTRKQLFSNLMQKVTVYELCSLIISIGLSYKLLEHMADLLLFKEINYQVFIYSCIGTILTLIILAMAMSYSLMKFLNRNSIIERLRRS